MACLSSQRADSATPSHTFLGPEITDCTALLICLLAAYRIEHPDHPGNFLQDFDDDGEAAAGGRLLHMLQVTCPPT